MTNFIWNHLDDRAAQLERDFPLPHGAHLSAEEAIRLAYALRAAAKAVRDSFQVLSGNIIDFDRKTRPAPVLKLVQPEQP